MPLNSEWKTWLTIKIKYNFHATQIATYSLSPSPSPFLSLVLYLRLLCTQQQVSTHLAPTQSNPFLSLSTNPSVTPNPPLYVNVFLNHHRRDVSNLNFISNVHILLSNFPKPSSPRVIDGVVLFTRFITIGIIIESFHNIRYKMKIL